MRAAHHRAYFARHLDAVPSPRDPLFFLHNDYFGGGLFCLRLANLLGVDQPLYALRPHGLGGEPLPGGIECMAAAHVATVTALRPHGPYRLAGLCGSAFIAYEMARHLAARGDRVDRLVLIAARGDYRERTRIHPIEAIARLQWWWRLDWRARCATLIRAGRRRLPRAAGGLPALPPTFWAYRRAVAAYEPGPYEGRVVLLWPSGDRREPARDATMGWGRVARDVQVVEIPGTHDTSAASSLPALAAALRAALG
jgi:thioesterase domain-containing protein